MGKVINDNAGAGQNNAACKCLQAAYLDLKRHQCLAALGVTGCCSACAELSEDLRMSKTHTHAKAKGTAKAKK